MLAAIMLQQSLATENQSGADLMTFNQLGEGIVLLSMATKYTSSEEIPESEFLAL